MGGALTGDQPMNDANPDPYDPPIREDKPTRGGSDEKDARQMAMLAHLSGILASLISGTLAGFAGPLIIWIIKKDESPFVADQAKEALNFQLTLLIMVVVCWAIAIGTCGILFFLPLIPFVLQLVFGVIGGMKANEGEYYRYPINIRFVS
jgi:uncharacterized Tic20 family protein